MTKPLIVLKCITVTLLIVTIIYGLINQEFPIQKTLLSTINNLTDPFTIVVKGALTIMAYIFTAAGTVWGSILISFAPLILLLKLNPKTDSLHTKYPMSFMTLIIGNVSICAIITIVQITSSLMTQPSITEAFIETTQAQKNIWLISFGFSMFLCYLQYSFKTKKMNAQKQTIIQGNTKL
jgi:hypothetical protein